MIYLALGDSTGAGVGARHGGYPARLHRRLLAEHPGLELVNLCVSGATTETLVRDQLPRVPRVNVALATLGIGINDVTHLVPVDVFERRFETIIERTLELGAPVVATNIPDISLAPVIPRFMKPVIAGHLATYNAKIAEACRHERIALVDAFALSRQWIPTHPEFFSADGFHPSDAGYDLWAETVWPVVQGAIRRRAA